MVWVKHFYDDQYSVRDNNGTLGLFRSRDAAVKWCVQNADSFCVITGNQMPGVYDHE